MEIEGKLSRSQTMLLVLGSSLGNIIYTFTDAVSIAGRAFWVAMIIGILLNIPFAVWILILGSYKQGGSLFDLLEDGLGKAVCKCILIIYFLLNVIIAVSALSLFTGAVKVFFLPRTPVLVIIFFIALICAIYANSGLKYFTRLIIILTILCLTNYFGFYMVSFFTHFRIEYIIPVFDVSYTQFIKAVLMIAGNQAECLLFLTVIVGFIPQTQKHYSAVIKGLFLWSIIESSADLILEGIEGHELLSGVAASGISVASIIHAGSFFSGLEILILVTYQYCAIVRVTVLLFSCWVAGKKFFNVSRGKPILIVSALLVVVASSWLSSYNRGFYLSVFLGNYIIPAFIISFLLLCTVSVFVVKNRKGKIQNGN